MVEFVDHIFRKAYHQTSFLKRVSSLAVWAFECYSMLIMLPLNFLKWKLMKWYNIIFQLYRAPNCHQPLASSLPSWPQC